MKKAFLTAIAVLFSISLFAHAGGHGVPLRSWTVDGKVQKAEFVKYELGRVWLRDGHHELSHYPLSAFAAADLEYVMARQLAVQKINRAASPQPAAAAEPLPMRYFIWVGLLFLFFGAVYARRTGRRLAAGIGTTGLVALLFFACKKDDISTVDTPANDTALMEAVFGSFSGVSTSSDETYFYVSSNGIPDHGMMVGITAWQQQVPIDHDYTGSNSWAIPLQPELAESPLSTQTNLLKGAVAIAANGIPIFNPLNNRGEDANAIGELDQWGGHCGRADDYHYHVPPTHLQTAVGDGRPIAWAVDGFPVYGPTSEQLDEYLGKFNEDGSYQYHTISEFPYFIAGMRGKVTLDPNTTAPENQVIPQAMTQGVRPWLTPLNGAEIVAFEETGTDAYSLTYTIDSETHFVNYNWDANGMYTYEFVGPGGTTTETYQR